MSSLFGCTVSSAVSTVTVVYGEMHYDTLHTAFGEVKGCNAVSVHKREEACLLLALIDRY